MFELTPHSALAGKPIETEDRPYFLSAGVDLLSSGIAELPGVAFADGLPTMPPYTIADIIRSKSDVADPGLQAHVATQALVVGMEFAVVEDHWLINTRLTGTNPMHMNLRAHAAFSFDVSNNIQLTTDNFEVASLAGRYMVASGEGADMYHHWMFDLLPRIVALASDARFADVKFLVPTDASRYIMETMRLLNLEAKIVRYDPKHALRVDELILCPVPMYDYNQCGVAALRLLRQSLISTSSNSSNSYDRVIFTRRDSPNAERQLVNEDDIINRLALEGFVPIEAGNISVADQIRIANQAEVSLCIHGSAGANMLFSATGSKVLHLTPDCVHYFYAHGIASSVAGAIYAHVFGPSFRRGSRAHNNPWLLSPDRIMGSVDKLLQLSS